MHEYVHTPAAIPASPVSTSLALRLLCPREAVRERAGAERGGSIIDPSSGSGGASCVWMCVCMCMCMRLRGEIGRITHLVNEAREAHVVGHHGEAAQAEQPRLPARVCATSQSAPTLAGELTDHQGLTHDHLCVLVLSSVCVCLKRNGMMCLTQHIEAASAVHGGAPG
jgi:hypothetical protein